MKADSQPRLVPALERATYTAERPVRRFVGSNRLNPLPHAGTISVWLLIVVVVSGVYITLFFSYGFEASYESVERMRDHPIQSLMRSIHRYSSAAFVLTTLVHAWRTFVAGRFRGPRRWRWTTGVASLALVWLAGVTGYWLVWDERAQALNEATMAVGGGWSAVSDFFVRSVYGTSAGSGWGVLFALWIAHLGLTVAIGYFVWRHVRRTQLPVLPPRHWMAAMFGALVVVSLLLPADLLDPADPARLVGDMPLDPFVLFLLPPLLSGWNWLAVLGLIGVVVAALVAPHVVRTRTPIVEIDAERCTGCELCVADCPYLALEMVDVSTTDDEAGVQPRRPLAVVDAEACVGCGICLGACSFGAMRLPGFGTALSSRNDLVEDDIDPAGRDVVIACHRHVDAGQLGASDELVIGVSCSGMVHANSIGALTRAGATSVHVVGCAAGDCAYGLGNTTLAERLSGTRAPHVAPKYAGLAAEDWVAPTDLRGALVTPGAHHDVDVADPPRGRRAVAAGALVLVSVIGVGVATLAPFRGESEAAGLRVVVDHRPGTQLEGQPTAQAYAGGDIVLAVAADGQPVAQHTLDVGRGFAIELVDVELDVDTSTLAVELREGDATPIVLFDGPVDLDAGERVVVEAIDVPAAPGVAEGKRVFNARSGGACGVCHSTKPGADGVGPSLAGVGTRAASTVPGLSAAAYLRESIIDPDAYVVDGYRAGQMLPIYEDRLSPAEIDALVEYLLSLTADPEAGS